MTRKRRTDPDALAYELHTVGLTYRTSAERLGVSAWRAGSFAERTLREAGKSAERRPPRSHLANLRSCSWMC